MIKTIIIDDEFVSRDVLRKMIDTHCPDVEIIKECSSADEGIFAIKQLEPQLVFLDINMPDKSGLDMLKEIDNASFEVIFVTAFHEYTIQAIRFSALDYLLKPVNKAELLQAVSRAKEKIENNQEKVPLNSFLHNINSNREGLVNSEMQICIPGIRGFQIIKIADIIYCESDNNYTHIFLTDGRKMMASRPLIDYDNMLSDVSFFRIHKSYLINLQHLKEYIRGEGGAVIMSNGKELEVSRRRKESFVGKMKELYRF